MKDLDTNHSELIKYTQVELGVAVLVETRLGT